jgi:hypothetical protein
VTLLTEAPAGRHFAQFHRECDALVESVFGFLEAGVRRGNSVLVVAGRPRVDQLFERLTSAKLHPKSLAHSGQLAVIIADELLEQVTADDLPAWPAFRACLAPLLSRLQPFGHGIRI